MSLRRPFRESWEEREHKRIARSQPPSVRRWDSGRHAIPYTQSLQQNNSTLAVHEHEDQKRAIMPSAEEEATSDEDYPEARALTPEAMNRRLDEVDFGQTPPDEKYFAGSEEVNSPHTVPNTNGYAEANYGMFGSKQSSNSVGGPVNDSASVEVQIGSPTLNPPHMPYQPKTRMNSKVTRPEDSVSQKASIVTTDLLSMILPEQNSKSDLERALLQSDQFPTQCLRPVPDFATLFTQIAPVMGDPDTGPVQFGPKSPVKAIFQDAEIIKLKNQDKRNPLATSIPEEQKVGSAREGRLPWRRDIYPIYDWLDPRSYGPRVVEERTTSHVKKSSEASSTTTTERRWKGRKYSIDPALRTYHLSIDLLERRISHGELLSLNLSPDARRDAITLGGTPQDIGGSLLSGTGRSASTSLPVPSTSKSNTTSSPTPSLQTTNTHPRFHSYLPVPTSTLIYSKSPPRSRPPVRNASMSTTSGHTGYIGSQIRSRSRCPNLTTTSISDRNNSPIQHHEHETHMQRYRASSIGSSFETGRYGTGGIMLWRIVRVAALVGEGLEGEEHVAWWCLPERSLGGWF